MTLTACHPKYSAAAALRRLRPAGEDLPARRRACRPAPSTVPEFLQEGLSDAVCRDLAGAARAPRRPGPARRSCCCWPSSRPASCGCSRGSPRSMPFNDNTVDPSASAVVAHRPGGLMTRDPHPRRRQLRQLRLHHRRLPPAARRRVRGRPQRRASAPADGADFDGVLVSPGPGTPEEAGVSMAMIEACAERAQPMLGVCLGHQALGVVVRRDGRARARAAARQDLAGRPRRHRGARTGCRRRSPRPATTR